MTLNKTLLPRLLPQFMAGQERTTELTESLLSPDVVRHGQEHLPVASHATHAPAAPARLREILGLTSLCPMLLLLLP